MEAKEKQILDIIEGQEDTIINFLRDLVKIPSLTGEEGEIQRFLQNVFEDMGLLVDAWEPDVKELFDKYPEIAQYPSSWQEDLDLPLKFTHKCTYEQLVESGYIDQLNYKGRPNVVGVLKGTGGGRSLILNGHCDVVTIEPKDDWVHDPFGGEMEGDILYGRGATDMKGGIAAMVMAVKVLLEAGVKLKGDVILQSVVNEEHSGNGTLACLARGYRADAAIVTHPSYSENVAIGSGGGAYLEIRLKGREAHTGTRWRDGKQYGISAIEKASLIIHSMLEMEERENQQGKYLSLGIGMIKGGSYATSTALHCVLQGVMYFSPEMGTGIEGIERVMDLLRVAVKKAGENDPWLTENPPQLYFLHYDDAYEYNQAGEILEEVIGAGQSVIGKDLAKITVSACDSRHLGNTGKIPTILYGPGTLGTGHSVDEHIDVKDLIQATKILALAIYRFCT